MLFPRTEMHLVTFGFICIEVVIMLYLLLYRFARPDNKTTGLDVCLVLLLITYNFTGGLLPDPDLPGSFFVQESIAYATGFFTPCYFPYYAYKGFALKKMKFHAIYGVFIFLLGPYIFFVTVFYINNDLNAAKPILGIPVIYALWVLFSLVKALKYKYHSKFDNAASREEIIVLLVCLVPWVGLPFIAYFNVNQATEAITTNTGFLLLLSLHLKRHVAELRLEHEQLMISEQYLRTWKAHVKQEIEIRTKEIERLNKEEKFKLNCSRYSLTRREQEIAFLVFTGNPYKSVADVLFISERTVAKHLQNIFDKISVSNRIELCHKLGL